MYQSDPLPVVTSEQENTALLMGNTCSGAAFLLPVQFRSESVARELGRTVSAAGGRSWSGLLHRCAAPPTEPLRTEQVCVSFGG